MIIKLIAHGSWRVSFSLIMQPARNFYPWNASYPGKARNILLKGAKFAREISQRWLKPATIVESLWRSNSRFTNDRWYTNVRANKSCLYMHNEAGSGQVFHIRFAHIPICLLIRRAFRWLVDCKSWNSCLRLPLTEFAAAVPSVPGYIYLFSFADTPPDGPVLALSLLLGSYRRLRSSANDACQLPPSVAVFFNLKLQAEAEI